MTAEVRKPSPLLPASYVDTASNGEPALRLSLTGVDARHIPAGMWMDVLNVLRAHGLDPAPLDVVMALARVTDATPADKGGRLLPDGSRLVDA